MEALTNVFSSSLGGLFKGAGGGVDFSKILGAGLTGTSFIQNWMNQRKQNEYLQRQLYYQQHPEAMQKEIMGLVQPLDRNLINAVTNQTQSWLGQQGLAESPNIMASVMGQALAPYQQESINRAILEWLQLRNIPIDFPKNADLSGLLKYFLPQRAAAGGPQTIGADFWSGAYNAPIVPPFTPGDTTIPDLGAINLGVPEIAPAIGG